MKKLLSLIILSAVILSSFTISACAAEEKDAIKSGDYTYILKGNDAQIINYTGNSAEVNIPETIDGHKVIKVGYDLASVESYYSFCECCTSCFGESILADSYLCASHQ